MPVLPCPIKELPEHVFRPLLQQITGRILETMGLRERIGDKIYINTDWSTHSATGTLEKDAIINQEGLRVDVNIQMNPTSQKWDVYTFRHTTAYLAGHHPLHDLYPIYYDGINSVKIVEIRSPVTITLNCDLTLRSADLAFTTPHQLFGRYENGAVVEFRDLFYDYPVPRNVLFVLRHLWEMDRSSGRVTGTKLREYIQARTGNTWQFHKHRTLDQYEVVVPSLNVDAQATLEYSDDRPQGVMKDKLPIGFQIPFVYTIQLEVPTQLLFRYPAVYNNQLIPASCVPRDRVNSFNAIDGQYENIAMDRYVRSLKQRPNGIVHTPYYDDWEVPSDSTLKKWYHRAFLIMAVTVDEPIVTDPDVIAENPEAGMMHINLDEFDDEYVTIADVTKEVLYQQGPRSVENSTLMKITVFKDDKELVPYHDYQFTEDLVLSFRPSSLHAHYRIVLSASYDLYRVHPDWYDVIKHTFPWLDEGFKYQVANAVQCGDWVGRKGSSNTNGLFFSPAMSKLEQRDPLYPPYVKVVSNGDIYDAETGRFIENIRDLKYPKLPNYDSSDIVKGDKPYGHHFTSRVVANQIIANPAKALKTRNRR